MGCGASAQGVSTKGVSTEGDASKGDSSLVRQKSKLSEESLGKLSKTSVELARIEECVADIATQFQTALPCGLGSLRKELAFLEAQAQNLESSGVDGVYAGNLNSGKVEVKQSKKDMLQRLEVLFSQMDDLFKKIKAKETENLCQASEPTASPSNVTRNHSCSSHVSHSSSLNSTEDLGRSMRKRFSSSGRRLSMASEESMDRLLKVGQDLTRIEEGVADIATTWQGRATSELAQLRKSLAEFEAEAKKIEVKGVDDVYTGELDSGKEDAKLQKKAMLQRLDKLFEQIDGVFQGLRSLQSEVAPTA